jgi:CheY-like chemotaxis protein
MPKILLIEDDPMEFRMYLRLLSHEGYEVDLATNGEDGLTKARASKPDLILLDVMMPKLNGFMVLNLLKNSDELHNIPVIMLTNLSGSENKDEAINKGASQYFIKSNTDNTQLLAAIKEIIDAYSSVKSGA